MQFVYGKGRAFTPCAIKRDVHGLHTNVADDEMKAYNGITDFHARRSVPCAQKMGNSDDDSILYANAFRQYYFYFLLCQTPISLWVMVDATMHNV